MKPHTPKQAPKLCPICKKSDKVIPIVYGMPGKKLFKEAEKGKVKLGGCCMDENNPLWFCSRDGYGF